MRYRPLQPEEEVALWNQIRAGQKTAFDQLYERYFSVLYGYGVQFTRNRNLVEDCIQELFIELWRNCRHLNTVHSVRFYLYRAIRRKIVKALEKDQKHAHGDLPEDYHFTVIFSSETLLIEETGMVEQRAALQNAVNTLTARQREALFLRFYSNLEYDEIAAVLSFKETKYARNLIYRALAELKQTLSVSPLFAGWTSFDLTAFSVGLLLCFA